LCGNALPFRHGAVTPTVLLLFERVSTSFARRAERNGVTFRDFISFIPISSAQDDGRVCAVAIHATVLLEYAKQVLPLSPAKS